MQLWVILNKSSGQTDAAQARDALATVFREEGCDAAFVPIPRGGLVAACDTAAREAVRAGGVLVAVGGDGTLNAVAQAALAHGCRMGAIPQGTFNYFGRGHGIPQDAQAAARALVRGAESPVQVGRVNGQVFLVNASLGLYPQLLEDRETFKQQLGRRRWVAFLAGLWTLFEWRRQLTLDIDWETSANLLSAGSFSATNLQFQVLGEVFSIPNVGGRYVVPDLSAFHSLIGWQQTGLGQGDNEILLPGTGVGRQLMRLYGQVQARVALGARRD